MVSVDDNELKCLFDLAINSMDFGSGFMDHAEVLVLRRFAVILGVDEKEATPDNFKASFAHDFTDPKQRFKSNYPHQPRVTWPVTVCGHCGRIEENPVHHGVSVTEPTSSYET